MTRNASIIQQVRYSIAVFLKGVAFHDPIPTKSHNKRGCAFRIPFGKWGNISFPHLFPVTESAKGVCFADTLETAPLKQGSGNKF